MSLPKSVAVQPKAKSAREERDKVNTKVANLKKERNSAQKEARELFERANEIREQLIAEGGMKNPDPKWAKDKLSTKLQSLENQLETSAGTHKTEEKFINEMKNLIKEHEEWCSRLAVIFSRLVPFRRLRQRRER